MRYKDTVIKAAKVVIFALVMVSFLIQLTYVYRGGLSHTRANICGFYAEKKNSLDIVIIGTSSTFSAFMPMEFWGSHGITAYDMCTNVLFENAIKYHVREMKKTQNPKLLIIDTAPFLYGHNSESLAEEEAYLRFNTDSFSLSKNRMDMIDEFIPENSRLDYYLDLIYYHGNKNPSTKYLLNKHKNERKGYNNLEQKDSFDESEFALAWEPLKLPERDDAYFIELLEELRAFEGEILFVEQPVFYTEASRAMCSHSEYMENKIKEYGYDYLDLSKVRDEIGIDSRLGYAFGIHFNAYSAEKITNYVADYIATNYDLEDHRGNPKYRDWQMEYEQWQSIKEAEKDLTESQWMAHFQEADLFGYSGYLQSDYFSSCVYIPADSKVWWNDGVLERLRKNGAHLTAGMNTDYFIIYDHSSGSVMEAAGKEKMDFNSAFGYVEYSNLEDSPRLFINGGGNNYLEGDNGGIHIILINKSTEEIVDNVCFDYNGEQKVQRNE